MVKKTLILMTLLTVGTVLLAAEKIFECNFTTEAMNGVNLKNIANVEQDDGDNVLHISIPVDYNGSRSVTIPLKVEPWSGKKVSLTYQVKYKNVSKANKTNGGLKLMIVYEADGKSNYCHAAALSGDSEWKTISTEVHFKDGAQNGYIQFIFDGVTGDAWFSDIKLELLNYNK